MKQIIVTTSWDDGHKLDLRLARLLEKYGLQGTFYIAPECREIMPDDRLSAADIKSLANNFEVGAHTITHPRLTQVDDVTAKHEIISSKKRLEEITKSKVRSFCYPGGKYDAEHVQIVRDAGFDYARTVRRFNFSLPRKFFEAGTSVHVYRHWSDVFHIFKFAKYHPNAAIHYLLNWDSLANAMFESVASSGGVFHMWGHSWEIDANNDWDKLENVFRHISNHPAAKFVTNAELVRLSTNKRR